MSDIDWSKVNDTAVAALVATKGNVHYPSIEFVAGYHRLGCMIRATSADDGRSLSAPSDCWYLVERPAVWSGEGLPPVGIECEVEWCEEWHQCEVIAHFEQRCGTVAAFTVVRSDGAKSLDALTADCFRPVRTPEQIAAEEREEAINEMLALDPYLPNATLGMMSRADFCRALFDAGYRRVEQ